jgi:hypothetical protein
LKLSKSSHIVVAFSRHNPESHMVTNGYNHSTGLG